MLYVFAACMLYNYVASGGSFLLFSGAVDVLRSFREKTPREARVSKMSLHIEYKFGKDRLYTIIFPKRNPIPWTKCAARVGGKWIMVTEKIAFCAGPFRNFYEIPITPKHIDEDYEKLGFHIEGFEEPVVVKSNEFIIAKLRQALRSVGSKM